MAKEQAISQLFIASDYVLRFAVLSADETTAVDISTFSLSWMLKKVLGNSDAHGVHSFAARLTMERLGAFPISFHGTRLKRSAVD